MELEETLHRVLCRLGTCLTGDKPIVKKYGKLAYGIDHYLEIGDTFITIQDKWEQSTPKLAAIRHFILATDHIVRNSSKTLVLAIFASKCSMSEIGLNILKEENSKHSYDIFIAINHCELDLLVDKVDQTIRKFTQYLPNLEEKWTLFPHQKDTLRTFKKMLHSKEMVSGIVSHPTGTGKTITAISMIGEFWKNNTSSVLWITERKDVLYSQFEGNKLEMCINSGFITSSFEFVSFYNQKADFKLLKSDKPILLVANIDSILYDNRYHTIDKTLFGMVILDESHSASAELTFDMLQYMRDNWKVKALIGFSATPVRSEFKKFQKVAHLFGDGKAIHFISRMTLIDAIDQEIVVPPKFYWVETQLDREVSFSKFINNLDRSEK
jgi:superfamily II DNA or RNA helicase